MREWVKQLIDLTGRNQLLYYRTLKRGTLELTDATPTALYELLEGGSVRLSQLHSPTAEDPARLADALRRARTVHSKAVEHFEERGIQTLFLACGMATWTPNGTASTPASPVLLRPLELKARGVAATDYDVVLHGDWDVNATLLHLLDNEFDLRLDAEELLAALQTDTFDASALFERLTKEAKDVPDFAITDRVVAGTFAYTKLPMVKDLQDNVATLASHDLIAAIAGVDEARDAIRELRARDVDPTLPDYTPPSDEYLILPADSSQNLAINAALAGEPLIVQGPPGTGKSQTIANLITSLTARGKRVLFVAEKRAAIDAVTKRLDAAGLGDLVMDLHGGVASKKALAAELNRTLSEMGRIPRLNSEDLHHRLESSRRALTTHADALHEQREPWGMSFFEVQDALIGMQLEFASDLRFYGHQLEILDAATTREVHELLREWAGHARPLLDGTSAWGDAQVTTPEQAERAYELAGQLDRAQVPRARNELDRVLTETGLPMPRSVAAWAGTLQVLGAVAATLTVVAPEVFDLDLEHHKRALSPASRRWWHRMIAQLFARDYREAKATIRALWRDEGKPDGRQLHEIVVSAADHRTAWGNLGGNGNPRVPADFEDAQRAYDDLAAQLAALGAFLTTQDLTQHPHATLDEQVRALAQDELTLLHLPRIHEIEAKLERLQLSPLLEAARQGESRTDELPGVFDHARLTSLRRHLLARDQRLRNFDGQLHHEHVEVFCDADHEHLEATAARVRRAVAEAALVVRNLHADQDRVVSTQANKKRGHLTLRRLFDQAPDVLTALRPCWAMSPLVVSQTLPATQVFDVVIFDEASQVLPADAIPALLRAPQAVVAGDRRQLPPTTFFASGQHEDEDLDDDGSSLLTGFESILDVLDSLLGNRMLTWHYRSQDERLIAFSNHTIYDGGLTTFPGAHADDCLEHICLPHRPGVAADTRSSDAEVERVVDLMIEQARNRPQETLGVIAMGQHHASRIEAALRQRVGQVRDRQLDEFFDESREERAFVKNLERVQGDERDAIILSIGYGKTADGRLPYRFGPLLTEGGERRLNVAVTRARRRLTLVSSFSHVDMEPRRSAALGVELLRRYLKYVESRGVDLDGAKANTPLNAFEIDVKYRLEQAGLEVIPQYGTSGFRIDFAIPHPGEPGKMLLAVEADGASYHSSQTARDRDRLRQEVLKRLGWRFHRIWSTDWFNDPEDQVQRVIAAYERALHADNEVLPEPSSPSSPGDSDCERAYETPGRGPRPPIAYGLKINEYRHADLVTVARWIKSDTLLRTHEQMLEAMMHELGFQRRGKRIIETLEQAIHEASRDV